MNTIERAQDWTAANQRLLVAEFARLRALLDDGDPAEPTEETEALRAAMPEPAAIDVLAQLFQLSAFERDVLLLSAGVEMDSDLARRCAEAQGMNHQPYATFGLALAALADPHWSALTPVRPLRRWRLIEIDDREGVTKARLRIDERVLHYLAGVNYLDTRLRPLLRHQSPPSTMAETHRQISTTALAALGDSPIANPLIMLIGDDADGQADVAAQVASALGLMIFAIRAEDLPQNPSELDALAVLWQREAALSAAALLIESRTPELSKPVVRLAEQLGCLLFIGSDDPLPLSRPTVLFRFDKPDAREQKQLWEEALGSAAGRLNGSLNGVASQFRLSARTIVAKGEELRPALLSADEPDHLFWNTCRLLGRTRLDDLAQRIDPAAVWDDLILPDPQKSMLQQIAAHVRQRLKVYEDWGFARKGARGLGISALFAGESGTGKTMAAEVLAHELHLDLYRIDLSSVVSKYIGETEKKLKRVFDAAEESGAILLFDEADSLFGKRSEVKDSHDRYANIEVSYLLQRMETYSGLAILTTNHKAALDAAFQRRLRFIMHFPFPDQAQREAIWRTVFPVAAPLNGIDYAKLARLNVAGGTIRNIALSAAFLAAEGGTPLGMTQLLRGAHAEAGKRDKPYSDAETRGWV
jgi:hypothetical protein